MAAFNPDQIRAIEADNHTILVSAAAGSGKTTVMVEKIKQTLLKHPDKHLSNMLVITFTREAASNMRRKLQDLLIASAEDPSLSEMQHSAVSSALDEIENAQISTIHSFCIQVIRSGFHLLDVDPLVRVGEEGEVAPMFDAAFEETMNTFLDPDRVKTVPELTDGDYQAVLTLLGAFSSDEILSMFRSLYGAMMGIPDPFNRLHELIQHISLPKDRHPWVAEILSALRMDLTGLSSCLDSEQQLAQMLPGFPDVSATAEADRAALEGLEQRVSAADSAKSFLEAVTEASDSMPKLKPQRKLSPADKEFYEEFKTARAKIKGQKGLLNRVQADLTDLLDPAQESDNLKIQQELQGLEILIRQFALEFRRQKQSANVIDFSDMEQMTYRLMTDSQHPEIRQTLQMQYTDIYVDESQDVSAIQSAIIHALHHSGNHLFMVGDVKQSIYRFRHAEPRLFMHLRDTYSMDEDAEERKIYFQDNYRSSAGVIDSVNQVFTMAMNRAVNELDYEEGDTLRANKEGNWPTEVILLRPEGDPAPTSLQVLEAQCMTAAEKISQLLSGNAEGEQPIQYRDIAILLRSARTDAPRMVEIFKRLHVPVYYDGAMNYYGLSEIAIFLSLLNVIDNMHQDIPLLAALRQTPFYLTDHDLQAIRMIAPGRLPFYEAFEKATLETDLPIGKRCAEVYRQIEEWHLLSGTMKASDFIWRLLRETGFYAVCGAYPDGRLRQNNLDTLYQKALDMEKRGIYRLSDFLSQIQTVIDRGQKDSDSPVAGTETDNCVRLMTMHKSKGLEYRAVILMNLSKNMQKKNSATPLQVDLGQDDPDRPALGVYLPVINPEKNTRRNTFGKNAFAQRVKRNEIAEQTRLLYVAMTRAMERLILIGTFDEKSVELWQEKKQISRIWRTRSLLDMVMPAVLSECPLPAEPGNEPVRSPHWSLTIQPVKPLQDEEDPQDSLRVREQILRLIEKVPENEAAIWNPMNQRQYPLKTSVSSLVRNVESGGSRYYHRSEDVEETTDTKRLPEGISLVPFLLDQTPGKPRFMEIRRPTAQDRGTATHRFLRLINLEQAGNTGDEQMASLVSSQIESLLAAGVLSREESEMIDINGVVRFFTSELGRRLTHAAVVHREWPFTYRISLETGTIIQGIIDAAMLCEGAWILIDYKTDHDTAPERFVARHCQQMNWYREAIEHLTGMPVSEMWLFALRSGQAYPVEKKQPDEITRLNETGDENMLIHDDGKEELY